MKHGVHIFDTSLLLLLNTANYTFEISYKTFMSHTRYTFQILNKQQTKHITIFCNTATIYRRNRLAIGAFSSSDLR